MIHPLTPELVERRLDELAQLSRLGASLLQAELPPLERRVLERRSLGVEGRVMGGATFDPRDVQLFVSPVAVERQLGWMPDCWVEPRDGQIVGEGLAVLVGSFNRRRPGARCAASWSRGDRDAALPPRSPRVHRCAPSA
jgi:hypothetical protein